MRSTLFALLILFSLGSCKKAIENAQEEAVLDAITSGYWTVTSYTKGTTDETSHFTSYKFQFKKNNTVDALKNLAVDGTGHWEANAVSKTIKARFESTSKPLILLNGTWTITKSTWTSVDVTQTIDGENCRLLLNNE